MRLFHLLATFGKLTAILLCLFRPGVAAERVEIERVRVGIGEHFRIGCWAPLQFDVAGLSDAPATVIPQVITADPDGHGVVTRMREVTIGPEVVTLHTLFRSGKIEAPVTIEILQDETVIARKTIQIGNEGSAKALLQETQFWMLAGDQPAFTAAAAKMSAERGDAIFLASFDDFSSDSTDSRTIESVNVIVMNADSTVSNPQSKMIQNWVQGGGRLVISVGPDGDALGESPLGLWLPFLPNGTKELRNLNGFNQLVPGSSPLRMLGSVPTAQFDPQAGKVIASNVGNPLVVRAAYGVGTVTMVGVRLDKRPFADWGSRAEFAAILAGFDPVRNSSRDNESSDTLSSGLNPTGVSDLQTQLVHALDHHDNVQRPSYWVVIGWSAILMLIVGPLDYFIVHQLIGRPQWTWATLPIWLTVITTWSYSSALATNQAEQQAIQIEVIDIDLSLHTMRGRSWFNFYSDKTQRSRVRASVREGILPGSMTAPTFLQTSWIERPESSYRGMYRSGRLESHKPVYHLSPDNQEIEDLPTRIWSTGSLGSDWETDIDAVRPIVDAKFQDPGSGRLTGTLTYQGPEELTEWFIAYGNFAYFPRTPKGESQAVLKQGDIFDLKTSRSNMLRGVLIGLTHTSIFEGDNNRGETFVVRDEYDTLSPEPYSILRTLSFHEVTGGRGYTNLSNATLAAADLSHLLDLHRAVLFGRIKKPVTEFTIDGETVTFAQQDSIVRIIVPVEYEMADLNAPPDPSLLKLK